MYCGFFIYGLLLTFIIHSTIFCVLITVKKSWYYYTFNASVVSFIIAIYPRCITTRIFHVYFEFINNQVCDVCWFFQGTILINSYTFEWVLFIHQFFQDEVDDAYRRSFGCIWKHPKRSILCTYYCDHGYKNMDRSDVVKCKVHVNKLYWLNVTGVKSPPPIPLPAE